MNKISPNKGDRFGRFTVIDTGYTIRIHNNSYSASLVKCDCGSEPRLVRNTLLKHGCVKSCGCLRREIKTESARRMGLSVRIYPKDQKCSICGAEGVYAKGVCRSCYNKIIRGGDKEHINMKMFLNDPEIRGLIKNIGQNLKISQGGFQDYVKGKTGEVFRFDVFSFKNRGHISPKYYPLFMEYIKSKGNVALSAGEEYRSIAAGIDFAAIKESDITVYSSAVQAVFPHVALTQTGLAKQLNLTRSAVNQWVVGNSAIPARHMPEIHKYISGGINSVYKAVKYIELLDAKTAEWKKKHQRL